MRTHVVRLAMLGGLAFATVAGSALADHGSKQVRFVGIHPLPKSEGGGICYIEGPHVHIFGADALQYRDHRGAHYFVGDPVAYGYEGPRYVYKGHHPIEVNVAVGDSEPDEEWCYLNGPHYHTFAPPPAAPFEVVGDAYFFVGTPPPVYVESRPALVKINAVYEPLVYVRPRVEVTAPDAWINVRYPVAAVEVVEVDRPRADVDVRVVVPRPPSVHIDVGVGIGFGGGFVVGGGDRYRYREKVHHDNGRHRGHHK